MITMGICSDYALNGICCVKIF